MNEFDHERLDVYVAAIEFVALADDVVEHLPRGRAYWRTNSRGQRPRLP